jgi:uncharacterized SAM-binding protein YcdF (DUF218 family)
MNSFLTLLGIESWKPILSALVLPPVPFLVLVLIGARLILPRRGLGWFVILVAVSGLWLSACSGVGQWLGQWVLKTPPALSAEAVNEIKSAVKAGKQPLAIVVLGGGVEPLAPEYRVANLTPPSMERLRYGLWLSRETGAPVAFSGGVGWNQADSQAEALVASRIASQDFGKPIKWLEDRSRDTRENASYTVAMLKRDGIQRIVLVTHANHMPRAMKMFEVAAQGSMVLQAAPMAVVTRPPSQPADWLPSAAGFARVNSALHELLGLLAGA